MEQGRTARRFQALAGPLMPGGSHGHPLRHGATASFRARGQAGEAPSCRREPFGSVLNDDLELHNGGTSAVSRCCETVSAADAYGLSSSLRALAPAGRGVFPRGGGELLAGHAYPASGSAATPGARSPGQTSRRSSASCFGQRGRTGSCGRPPHQAFCRRSRPSR